MNIMLFSYPDVIHKNDEWALTGCRSSYNCSDDRKLWRDITSPPVCYKIMGGALNRDLHPTDKCLWHQVELFEEQE